MPDRLWVVNASPIISLANIGYANLLPDMCDQLVIPRAVEHEILDGEDGSVL
jgi:predicted nucleic acid-binding protein